MMKNAWEIYESYNFSALLQSHHIYFTTHSHTHHRYTTNDNLNQLKRFINDDYPILSKFGILPDKLSPNKFTIKNISDKRRMKYSLIIYPNHGVLSVQEIISIVSRFVVCYSNNLVPRDWRLFPWSPIYDEIKKSLNQQQ